MFRRKASERDHKSSYSIFTLFVSIFLLGLVLRKVSDPNPAELIRKYEPDPEQIIPQ